MTDFSENSKPSHLSESVYTRNIGGAWLSDPEAVWETCTIHLRGNHPSYKRDLMASAPPLETYRMRNLPQSLQHTVSITAKRLGIKHGLLTMSDSKGRQYHVLMIPESDFAKILSLRDYERQDRAIDADPKAVIRAWNLDSGNKGMEK